MLSAATSGPTRAQPTEKPPSWPVPKPAEEYKRHLDLGVKLFNDRNYDAAIAEFEAAYDAEAKASPLINIALSQKALFRYPAAIATLEKALAEHDDTMTDKDKAAARAAIEEMKSLLAHVRLEVSPPHAEVRLDGVPVNRSESADTLTVGPGTHEIQVSADGYGSETRSVTVASGDRDVVVRVHLVPSQGYLRVNTGDPQILITVDDVVVGRGDWAGLLAPGPHIVRMGRAGEVPKSVQVDVVAGKSLEVTPERGGRPLAPRDMPEVPPPPPKPPPETEPGPPERGAYALVTASLMFPVTHPFRRTEPEFGGAGGLRVGYRVNTVAAFDFMVEYEDVAIDSNQGVDPAKYSLISWRLGPTLRLMTPTRSARLYGTLGGGLAHDDVEFRNVRPGIFDCETENLCVDSSGFDPFFIAELGFELDFDGVLVGAAFESIFQSSKGIDHGGEEPSPWDDDTIVQIGPSLRVGYALW